MASSTFFRLLEKFACEVIGTSFRRSLQSLYAASFFLPVMISPHMAAIAQETIPCEKTFIFYANATSKAECLRVVGGQGIGRQRYELLMDTQGSKPTVIVVAKIGGRAMWDPKLKLRKSIEVVDEYIKQNGHNWSDEISTKTKVGSILYQTFMLDQFSCFGFVRRKHSAYIIYVWRCHFEFGAGTMITKTTVRELAEAVLIRGEE